ncbi:MAG: Type 1 glutamine amidotransferase-like domain-containing protein [Pseudomonadota bacterium]
MALHADADDRHLGHILHPEQELKSLGFSVSELDLRTYFNRSDDLENQLAKSDLIWVLGGNSFVLRRAMALSGFDSLATRLLRSDTIAYGGFSAGAVVAAPTMDGIHLMDDPNEIPQNYPAKPLWEGLGWTDFSIIPHFKSNHPEAENAEATKTYFAKRGMPFRTLKDGEVLLNKGNGFELLSKT